MIERIKQINRALLELEMGILFLGVVGQIIGCFFAKNIYKYSVGLWFGIALAFVASIHMYRSLDRALDLGANANKVIVGSFLTRYLILFLCMVIIHYTQAWNPLVTFLSYMSMKVAAYVQPFTHKVCNKIFNEVDPIPEALPEEEETQNND